MVTVYANTDLIFQALKAGACGYILKRFRPEEIIQAIAEGRAGGAPEKLLRPRASRFRRSRFASRFSK
jgi:DNA-binding NarL/FixJ family response regulator